MHSNLFRYVEIEALMIFLYISNNREKIEKILYA